MEKVDIVVTGELLVTDPFSPPVKDGAVAVKDGKIIALGPKNGIETAFYAAKRIDRPNGLIAPGLINAHTHAAMTVFRGLADDLPLKTWLEEHIFPKEARLTPEIVAIGTELACAEMIRCGTTGFVDMYLFEDTVASVVDRIGLRAWIGEGVFDFPSPAFSSGIEALKETGRLISKWQGHPRITITVDPHTPYTCSPDLLIKARDMADKYGAMTVIHLAETDWEAHEIQTRFGTSPVCHLDRLGLLNERLLAVHCVSLDKDDIKLLARKRARVAHCPESNLKLASGVAPIAEMIQEGVIVALGTDGAASNNDLDLMSEMDTAAKLQKGIMKDPTFVPASQALAMATTWAAKALHREDLGVLRKGAQADLVVVDLNQVHLRPCYNPVSHIVYVARSGDVQDVIASGRVLMEDRRLTTIDEEDLLSRLKRIVQAI
ncbi:MAG: amidohydrolase [Dissulfurimicrobium hydrothermale]|uniref:amidohydrolase n=2 Tax=Dissulfurimicrobium TaxID=1769732 RepID=UPI003C77200B